VRVEALGIGADLPPGWEARITRRDPAQARAAGAVGTPHPVAHLATFPLPEDRGDYGSGAVDRMTAADALVVLVEHDPTSVGTALFAPVGLPRDLRPGDFDPMGLQRTIPGQAGHQRFFTEAGRAFCLYVVLGAHRAAVALVPQVNAVLRTIRIDPR
jgi:hypothetical protein